jgi:hypothetical protein
MINLTNKCLIAVTNPDNIYGRLKTQTKEELLNVLQYHKERLRIETSELARELRGDEGYGSYLMILESLQVQLSQIKSIDL